MIGVQVCFEDGTAVSVERGEAHRLIDLLWSASACRGSLFAIRKIQGGLADSLTALTLSALEANAVDAALNGSEQLPPTLARLHEAFG